MKDNFNMYTKSYRDSLIWLRRTYAPSPTFPPDISLPSVKLFGAINRFKKNLIRLWVFWFIYVSKNWLMCITDKPWNVLEKINIDFPLNGWLSYHITSEFISSGWAFRCMWQRANVIASGRMLCNPMQESSNVLQTINTCLTSLLPLLGNEVEIKRDHSEKAVAKNVVVCWLKTLFQLLFCVFCLVCSLVVVVWFFWLLKFGFVCMMMCKLIVASYYFLSLSPSVLPFFACLHHLNVFCSLFVERCLRY